MAGCALEAVWIMAVCLFARTGLDIDRSEKI